MRQLQQRLQSIDVFRALTMFLMIFVNDFDGVENVPEWVKHAKASEDALGFADIIFPAFLFILGLSIPIAIRNRVKRNQTKTQIFFYILLRAFALLVMGFFHVNLENYSRQALLPRPVWEILITIAFFIIWLDYPETLRRATRNLLQSFGVILLLALAIIYKGENGDHLLVPMRPQWYGILGLIGWSYLICASLYLFTNGKTALQFAAWLFFFLFSVGEHAGLWSNFESVRHYIWIVGSGSMPAFTMAGVAVAVLYRNVAEQNKPNLIWFSLIAFGTLNLVLGFLTRPLDGISKIHDTPSWVGICTGISILAFTFFIYLVDVKGKAEWFKIIKPAGTVTLTCYLIPYLLYSCYELCGFSFPQFWNEGWGGFFRSVVTAFIVIQIAGWLSKKHIRLKL